MQHKSILILLIPLLFFSSAHAQKVQFRRGKVLVDKAPVMLYYRINWGDGMIFSRLDGSRMIAKFQVSNNGTRRYKADDYDFVRFPTVGIRFKTVDQRKKKEWVQLMLAEGVIDGSGGLNEAAARSFAAKYENKPPDPAL